MKKQSKKQRKFLIKKSKKGNKRKKQKIKSNNFHSRNQELQESSSSWIYYGNPENQLVIRADFVTELGNENSITCFPRLVFPFVSIQNFRSIAQNKYYQVEGTGFFIHEIGLFVTAKHVPFYQNIPLETWIGIHSHQNVVSVRHVQGFVFHETADICVGFFDKHDPRNRLIYTPAIQFQALKPCFEIPNINDSIKNFGYGGSRVENIENRSQDGNFTCQWGSGTVSQILLEGRDSSTLPGSTIEALMPTIGKASGGPVFNSNGEVIGVNSTSFNGEQPISYFTPIYKILELEIEHEILGRINVRDLFSS